MKLLFGLFSFVTIVSTISYVFAARNLSYVSLIAEYIDIWVRFGDTKWLKIATLGLVSTKTAKFEKKVVNCVYGSNTHHPISFYFRAGSKIWNVGSKNLFFLIDFHYFPLLNISKISHTYKHRYPAPFLPLSWPKPWFFQLSRLPCLELN